MIFAVPITFPSAAAASLGIVTVPTFTFGVVFFAFTLFSVSFTGSSMPLILSDSVSVPMLLIYT